MRWLWTTRVSPMALVLLLSVSAVTTVVIVHSGLKRTPAQTAALAQLAAQRELLAQAAAHPATSAPAPSPSASSSVHTAGGSGGGGGGGGSGASSAAAATPAGDTGSGDTGNGDTSSDASPTASTTSTTSSSTPAPDAGLPTVGHVFLITLSTPSYADAFGHTSPATYLRSLEAKGTLLTGFASLGHGELADELAMVSGQAPNRDTSRGCTSYSSYPSSASANAAGEVSGAGCVYPDSALTIGDQVTSDGRTWGAYVADMGTTTCQHPNSNADTDTPLAGTEEGYDVGHNPFVFFHSVLDDGDCQSDDQDLTRLPTALAKAGRTPRFVYLAADACADADPVTVPASTTGAPTTTSTTSTTSATSTTSSTTSTTTTASSSTTTTAGSTTTPAAYGCPAGQPSGLAAEDAFLKQWVPRITSSPAYR